MSLKFNYEKINKEKIIEDLLESPSLSSFLIDNDLTSDFIESNLLLFMSYNTEKQRCSGCKGLHVCTQDTKGLEPFLSYTNKKVMKTYSECKYLIDRQHQEQSDQLIDAMHLPSSIYEASFDEFDNSRSPGKEKLKFEMISFLTKYKNNERPNGMYIHGKNNTGKTYALSALGNELRKEGISVIIAYYPDLVREFKSRVANNNLEELISKLKTVEVLMLDDIGGEGKSVWVRDEILGPILQYRFLDKRSTFFSSNRSIEDLALEHFAGFTTPKDRVGAIRVARRIRNLVEENEFNL